jgi:hypothetical protein
VEDLRAGDSALNYHNGDYVTSEHPDLSVKHIAGKLVRVLWQHSILTPTGLSGILLYFQCMSCKEFVQYLQSTTGALCLRSCSFRMWAVFIRVR